MSNKASILNWYIKESHPQLNEIVELCYDKLTSLNFYIFTSQLVKYNGNLTFKSLSGDKTIDMSKYKPDRHFVTKWTKV